jgi:hypothetical protein
MPMYLRNDSVDIDEARRPEGVGGCDVCGEPVGSSAGGVGGYASGETQVHIESRGGDVGHGDLLFASDSGDADVELMVKLLDGHAHNRSEALVHDSGWLMV